MKRLIVIISSKKFFAGLIATLISAACFLLALNVLEKKSEAKYSHFNVVKIDDLEDDPKVWAKNFPLQYDDYMKTTDMTRTRHGGSEAMPHMPTTSDPRSVTSQSKLVEDPRLVTMWAGYAFSKDFREERGHAFMLEDQLYTERQKVGQPGTCINCHASTYKAMMTLGEGNLEAGFHKLNSLPYFDAAKHVKHPVSCIDCHNPSDMKLRVTKPAFMAGIKDYMKTQNVHDFDVNRDATRAQMRTFVCAQCHVEYYFKGKEKTLTYPWAKGIKGDEILSYYNDVDFKDWTHKLTNAPVLKAQHPEFEMFSQGIHARSGVSCVDCHMPYKREGAMKITDHQVRSPMLNINRACQTCHNISEDKLLDRVANIQDKHLEMRDMVFDALVAFIKEIESAKEKNIDAKTLEAAQKYQRDAQFLFDFVEAENSTGFHAPQEAARILVKSLDNIRKGQAVLKQ